MSDGEATRTELPPLLREQLLLDELSPARRRALEQELGAQRLEAIAAELRADDAELAERFAPERLPSREQLQALADRQRARKRSERAQRIDLVLQRMVLAGIALLAVASPLWLPDGTGETNDGGGAAAGTPTQVEPPPALEPTRIKGGPRLLAFRKRGEVVEPLAAGASARQGDLLQLGYDAAGQRHGVLLSIDGRGVVTLHHPLKAGLTTALDGGGQVLLPSAYALDDAPRFERFVLVTGPRPIDVASVVAAAERVAQRSDGMRHAPLELARGLRQTSLHIDKEAP